MGYKWKGSSFPQIDQAIKVIGRPDISPVQLSDNSNLKVEWECLCGQIFMRRMDRATRYGVKCRTCSTSSSSRLEFEVAYLLQAYLPQYTVIQGYTHPEYYKVVDMYIEELDLAIELDPYHSHFKKVESDVRITKQLLNYFSQVLRIRQDKLSPIEDSLVINTKNVREACEWVKAILLYSLISSSVNKQLNQQEIDAALSLGNEQWDSNQMAPLKNPASAIPEAPLHFIRNITRPGRRLEYTPTGSSDVCEWKCLTCGSTYKLTIQRFIKGTRCPKEIGEKLRIISMSNTKFPKLIDTHPEIFRQLVKNVEYPDFRVELTNTKLRQDCLWKCECCGYEWISKPYVRVKQPPLGCRKCTWDKKQLKTLTQGMK